ncbi:MAG: hypothetical protein KJ732_02330 [Candidatus Margulisbacteria bacterium]|nr:hypothetical protein [Candidatus Margulisiibacteriota bacterium]
MATARTSANYQITIDSFDAGIGLANSSSYSLLSEVRERDLESQTGTDRIVLQGFKPAAYFTSVVQLVVTAIDPTSAYNIAPVQTTITGRNFAQGATASFTSTTEATITGTISSLTGTEIKAEFDLVGANSGFRTVVVRNPDGQSGSLSNAFEVKQYITIPDIIIISPNPFNPRTQSTGVIYSLDAATNIKVYIFGVTGKLLYVRNISAGAVGAVAGNNVIYWDGSTSFGKVDTTDVFLVHIIEQSSNKILARGKIATVITP